MVYIISALLSGVAGFVPPVSTTTPDPSLQVSFWDQTLGPNDYVGPLFCTVLPTSKNHTSVFYYGPVNFHVILPK